MTETKKHEHSYSSPHSHSHSPGFNKRVSNRLSKAIGHLNKVKAMVQDEVDCADVLTQLLAVKAAIDSTGKYILKEHMTHCIADAIREGNEESIKDIDKLVDSFLK